MPTTGATTEAPALRDGRVHTEALEVNAAWHCNISCQWCSHASPELPQTFADEQEILRDLQLLARWMHVDHVRVLGGEPLLHPHLPALLYGLRATGVGNKIRVVTNGLLLPRIGADVWDLVDEVHVSVYPNTRQRLESQISQLREQAEASHTVLVLKYFDYFRIAYRDVGEDTNLTERIYRTCQIANLWRCLTVESGQLHRCPQSAYLSAFSGKPREHRDHLDIAQIRSAREILLWLRGEHSLESCQHCAGSVGVRVPHRQRSRTAEVRPTQQVDYSYMRTLEEDITTSNGCVSSELVANPGRRP